MAQTLEVKTDEAWSKAVKSWSSPSIPSVIVVRSEEEMKELGEIGKAIKGQLAFMKYPEFQTYVNLETIAKLFPKDTQRGLEAIETHEVGHRYCPYDVVTSILLTHAIKTELEGEKLPYSIDQAAPTILNLYTDMCINTALARRGNEDISWAYEQMSPAQVGSKVYRVYAKSMELAWKKEILPKETKLSDEETEGAKQLASLFNGHFFDKTKWRDSARKYARIIHKFLEEEKKDKGGSVDDISGNAPQKPEDVDERMEQEIAKRLAEIGSDGLPANPKGLEEFKEVMAGFGKGNPIEASISFYNMLAGSYDVMFASKPFGRPRVNPFQPVKWNPSMGAEKLDINYSAQVGGRIIPGVNSYAWKSRKRESHGGFEEVIPNLDIYLDSSMSMPNPVEEISLPVLAGFVAARKANRKGALVRVTNFSGQRQHSTQDSTTDLQKVYKVLAKHFNGGTVVPTNVMLEGQDPRQVLIISDVELGNPEQTAEAISELMKRNKGNKVSVYTINPSGSGDSAMLRNAGAEVIRGTTTDIFKRVIGKSDEVYTR